MKSRSLLILSAMVFLFASCGKKGGNSGLLVPKDAAVVVHINSSSLASKLSWNEIKQTSWFKKLQSETNSSDTLAQKLLDDPSRSGVDTKQDFVMFVKKQGRGSYMVIEGSLTSQAAYEQVLAEMTKKEPKEIKKEGEFSYMVPHDKSVVLWNKSKFAMVTNAHMPGNIAAGGFMKNRRPAEGFEFESDSLRVFGEQALTLEGGDNLDSDSRFADLVKNGSDVHIWLNIGQYYTGMNTMMPMAKTDALFKDNITAMSINFDNGKITAKSKHYFSEEMNKIMADNKPVPVSADVINRIPSSNVVAVMAFNYSPTALKETLKVMGMDAVADIYLSKLDFSVDEFVKANKGEMLVVVSDPKAKMDTMKFGGQTQIHPSRPDVNILFATSVNDKPAFEKMVTLAWDLSKKLRGGMSEGTDKPGIPGISYKLENNWFAVSNSADYTDKFLAGGSNKQPFVDKIIGHPLGLYIDLQRIIKFAGSMIKDSSAHKEIYDASLNMWEDITAKGGDYKDKSSEAEFEINLVDKNTNSLKQLNQYIDKMATIMETMKKERAEKWKNVMIENPKDSSAIAMPKNKKSK